MRRFTTLLALLLAFALLAAACGDDTAPDADPDVELTASARGITEDTIRIGLAIPDVSQFSNTGDQVARYRVVADEINRNGGVIGRQIELVVTERTLTDTTGFDAACVQLTEDEEVFAVVSRTPSGFGDMTCFTDLGNTITVNGLDLDAAQVESSCGKLFNVLSDAYAALYGGIELLGDELVDAKIAIAAGSEGSGDPTASLTEQDRFAQIWSSAGATHVIGAAYAIDNQDLESEMVLITSNLGIRTLNSLGADLSVLQMIGVAAPDPGTVAEAGLHDMGECIALIEEQLGETVIFFPEEEEEEDLLALSSTWMACASFEMTGSATASVAADKPYMNDDPGTIYDWDGTAFTPRG